ncbi:MAG TPA: hypothetical protein VGV38_23090 [Pyrinomonadaceae bacterium]|nr:hypothetical protein [Pyrinomonadaceae bacterium]
MFVAHLHPGDLSLSGWLLLGLAVFLIFFCLPLALVLVVWKVFSRGGEKPTTRDIGGRERTDARQLQGGAPPAR